MYNYEELKRFFDFLEMKVRVGHLISSWLNEYKVHQFAESDLFCDVLYGLYEDMHSQYRYMYTVSWNIHMYIHATFPASCIANKGSEFVIHVQGTNQKYSVNWLFVEQYCILNRSWLHSATVFVHSTEDYKHVSRSCIVYGGKAVTTAIKGIIFKFSSLLYFNFFPNWFPT